VPARAVELWAFFTKQDVATARWAHRPLSSDRRAGARYTLNCDQPCNCHNQTGQSEIRSALAATMIDKPAMKDSASEHGPEGLHTFLSDEDGHRNFIVALPYAWGLDAVVHQDGAVLRIIIGPPNRSRR
jgi:hypothetical protein